ncbi:hypothetical protein Saso_34730 [Streptomyces asoensis]|uniref:Metallothionein n=2 Tax=Streptomyces TaxID=1883 RepID=A0ABQ3S117_9ACTN|nr:hypothetical protein GCM10010496_28080 [Streptomyces asoensis]GHI61823.1 hypothetical protein Saso_34730 [Streptomyces asoensis]
MQWTQGLRQALCLREEPMAESPTTPTPDPAQERPTEQPAEIRNLMLIGACGCGSGCGCGCQSGNPCQCG